MSCPRKEQAPFWPQTKCSTSFCVTKQYINLDIPPPRKRQALHHVKGVKQSWLLLGCSDRLPPKLLRSSPPGHLLMRSRGERSYAPVPWVCGFKGISLRRLRDSNNVARGLNSAFCPATAFHACKVKKGLGSRHAKESTLFFVQLKLKHETALHKSRHESQKTLLSQCCNATTGHSCDSAHAALASTAPGQGSSKGS